MKLSRSELIRATDKQLQVIGVRRKNNAGWLRDALQTDFSIPQAAAFQYIGSLRPKLLPKPPRQQVLEKPEPDSNNSAIVSAARAVVAHWNEFGPDCGFEETIVRLEKALNPVTPEAEINAIYLQNRSEFE